MMSNCKPKILIILYLVIFQQVSVIAQDDSSTVDLLKGFEEFKRTRQSASSQKYLDKIDKIQMEKYNFEESLQKYYQESIANRNKVFKWSHTSSVIIFWMVFVIVFLGMIFSAIQFYISMLNSKNKMYKSEQGKKANKEDSGSTNLKISLQGLEVNSSVLGVIILVISLAFFYLYLVYVYPVKEYNIENKIHHEISGEGRMNK